MSLTTLTKSLTITLVCLGIFSCSQEDPVHTANLAEAEASLRSDTTFDAEKETMIRVLELDETEARRLGQAFDRRYERLEQFLSGEKGQRLIALEADLRVATTARDLAAVKGVIDQATPLREAFRQLIKDHNQALLDTLMPEQATHWQGYEVGIRLLETMMPLDLSADQMVAISQAGPPAFFQAQQTGEVNPKAAAFLQLERWAESDVLLPAQREAYEAIKGKRGLRSLGI